MPKNIILLSDGTGNSAGKHFKTNVWRLYQALDLSQLDAAGAPSQIAYYHDGVGSSSFKPLAVIGGAFGWGLKRNVIDLYTFVCRNYEPGDRIYAFGFSRGAFTIRVLTGFINNQGLVEADTDEELKALAREAFDRYREIFRSPVKNMARPVQRLAAKATKFARKDEASLPATRNPNITFLGLWDTVAAYGLPFDELTRALEFFFPLSVPDREPCSNVERAYHALALDDERNTFHPVLWNEGKLENHAGRKNTAEERITQVWFTGMHANVGGGYPDDALANVSLHWMMAEAQRLQVKFRKNALKEVEQGRDTFGKLYDARRGVGGGYRYLPRKMAVLTKDTDNEHDQVVIERPKIHHSVFDRITHSADGYAPIVLPPNYAVVEADGTIRDLPDAGSTAGLLEDRQKAEGRAKLQEKVWNLVWCKRVAYFSAVFVGILFAVFPWVFPGRKACVGELCGFAWVIDGVGALLPSIAGPWLTAYRTNLLQFFVALGIFVLLLYTGGRLRMRIFDQMRAIWHREASAPAATPGGVLYPVRTSAVYQALWKATKRVVLPAMAGVAAMMVIVGVLSKGVFDVMASAGFVCAPTPREQLRPGRLEQGQFHTDQPCWSSGVELQAGVRYRLTIRTNDHDPWQEGSIDTNPRGFGAEQMKFPLHALLVFRRYLGEPWFKPIARVGSRGADEYPLEPAEVLIPDESGATLVAEFTARRNGELFLFVNDAVLPVPKSRQLFYGNNRGSATVTVRPTRTLKAAKPPNGGGPAATQ